MKKAENEKNLGAASPSFPLSGGYLADLSATHVLFCLLTRQVPDATAEREREREKMLGGACVSLDRGGYWLAVSQVVQLTVGQLGAG